MTTNKSFLQFWKQPTSLDRKTYIWEVRSLQGAPLGVVEWFNQWRRYTFLPNDDTVFDVVCLREIADFIEARMNERKALG
jgi:hypothetical protein